MRRGADGHPQGPEATVVARAEALARVDSARSLVLVEGISDVIALEAAARRIGLDLADHGVVLVPMGGAQAISNELRAFRSGGDRRLSGLCDAGEEHVFLRALAGAGLGAPRDRRELERLGFFVCVDDLEEELIRGVDPDEIEELLAAQGDLASFRTLQKQAFWRGRPFEAQMHRWLRAGARRNLRYADLLVEVGAIDRIPRPLIGVLGAAAPG